MKSLLGRSYRGRKTASRQQMRNFTPNNLANLNYPDSSLLSSWAAKANSAMVTASNIIELNASDQ